MKKIQMNGIPQTVTPTPVQATAAFVPDAPGEAPLPPAPPQMNNPVGPPPAAVPEPKTFEELMVVALKARGGRLDFAQFWASMAQASATKQVADRLEELVVFLGARDGDADEQRVFSDVIADGIINVALAANEELLPEGMIDLAKAAMAARMAELGNEMKK